MKYAVTLLVLFALFGAVLAHAQPSNPPFQHVIIVIQENRTPDNLFGAYALPQYPSTLPPLGPGYDIALAGDATPWCLGTCFDPLHTHTDWEDQYAQGGSTYNACPSRVRGTCTSGKQTCNGETIGTQMPMPSCPQDTYSSPSYDAKYFNNTSPLVPYFDIAAKYGFANYFFQTNQGPSEPAHDFLFGGTSSPTGALGQTGDTSYYFQLFSGENVNLDTSGCGTSVGASVYFPNGQATDSNFNSDKAIKAPPCFDRQTLADLLDNANPQLTWRYYTNTTGSGDDIMGIWTAPAGIQHLCRTDGNFPNECNSQYFTGAGNPYGIPNVIFPSQVFFADAFTTPGGTNINAPPPPGGTAYCDLPNVTWIIPNGAWSDHPGGAVSQDYEIGPDWVASIINAVGNAGCTDPVTNGPLWDDTVIFVTWDDWGGFYDHVGGELPFKNDLFPNFWFGDQYTNGPNGGNLGCFFTEVQGGNWGCGYTYGWRVPFLVVSKWTPEPYVSGACGAAPLQSCPQPAPYYVHDFGSILAFIENNFGLGMGCINGSQDRLGNPCNNSAATGYPFADYYFPEGQVKGGPYLPLGDFFGLWWNSENSVCLQQNPNDGCPRSFDAIQCVVPTNPPSNYSGSTGNFCPGYFTNYNGPVEDPDNDVIDND